MAVSRETFQSELERLQEDLLRLGTLVEEAIYKAVTALKQQDADLARQVVEGDDVLDRMTEEIEGRCLELLALQQPLARDLRVVGTALKIVTDLERMGDHAVDIAKVTLRIAGQPFIKPLVDIPRMAEIARSMLRDCLRAYVNRDVKLAEEMIERDHEVDHLYNQVFRELLVIMMEDPKTITQATHLLFVAQYLERIGDHATNLAEWVIYMATGERKELNV